MAEFNWDAVKAEMEMQEWEDSIWDDDHKVRAIFLGTVFALTPSGKYYMPWACGNVTEEEARQDELWWERVEKEAEEHGYSIESGEGDPCDILAVEYKER